MLAANWTTVSYTKERDPDVICLRENIKYSRLITILPRKARLNPFSGLFMHHSFHIYIHIYFIETPFQQGLSVTMLPIT